MRMMSSSHCCCCCFRMMGDLDIFVFSMNCESLGQELRAIVRKFDQLLVLVIKSSYRLQHYRVLTGCNNPVFIIRAVGIISNNKFLGLLLSVVYTMERRERQGVCRLVRKASGEAMTPSLHVLWSMPVVCKSKFDLTTRKMSFRNNLVFRPQYLKKGTYI